jgi:4-carboxymuconolactone decarboxylase
MGSLIMSTNTRACSDRYARGEALLNKIHGDHTGEAIVAALDDVCPDLARMTIEWGFGDIVSRPGIDLKTRELVTIASCVTLGHAVPQLRARIEGALNVGATPQEIVEVILQVCLYAGFAAGTNAMLLAADVFKARPTTPRAATGS